MDLSKIECEKCGITVEEGKKVGNALMNYQGMWLCGGCFLKVRDKIIEKNRKMVLEEI